MQGGEVEILGGVYKRQRGKAVLDRVGGLWARHGSCGAGKYQLITAPGRCRRSSDATAVSPGTPPASEIRLRIPTSEIRQCEIDFASNSDKWRYSTHVPDIQALGTPRYTFAYSPASFRILVMAAGIDAVSTHRRNAADDHSPAMIALPTPLPSSAWCVMMFLWRHAVSVNVHGVREQRGALGMYVPPLLPKYINQPLVHAICEPRVFLRRRASATFKIKIGPAA